MILPAQSIRRLCSTNTPLVSPFYERTIVNGRTFGLSCAGYDVRIAENLELRPRQFALASTMERFIIPDNILFQVCDKSSLARRGAQAFNTIGEPGWTGYLTLELVNHSNDVLAFESGDPIAQIIFMRLSYPTHQPYNGKYQDQRSGAVPAIYES